MHSIFFDATRNIALFNRHVGRQHTCFSALGVKQNNACKICRYCIHDFHYGFGRRYTRHVISGSAPPMFLCGS